MKAIKMFLAALAALVCFPALAADSTATAGTKAGLSVWLLYAVPDVVPLTLGCVRTFINPTKIDGWIMKPLADFSVAFDGDTCPSWTASSGTVVNFVDLDEESGGQVTATAGAYIYAYDMSRFRQAVQDHLQQTRW